MQRLHAALRRVARHLHGFHTALGLFLLVGLGLSAAGLWLFAEIAEAVVEGEAQGLDERVMRWMGAHGAPWLDRVALEVTALGAVAVVLMTLLVATAFLWISRHHYSVLLLWVAVGGGSLLNLVLKLAFGRPRPALFPWRTQYAAHASFPSGHAMTAAIAYFTLAYLITRLAPTRRIRRVAWAFVVLVVLLVAASRVYLGVHYPSDVVAGVLLGLVWSTVCAAGLQVMRALRARRPGLERVERDLEPGPR